MLRVRLPARPSFLGFHLIGSLVLLTVVAPLAIARGGDPDRGSWGRSCRDCGPQPASSQTLDASGGTLTYVPEGTRMQFELDIASGAVAHPTLFSMEPGIGGVGLPDYVFGSEVAFDPENLTLGVPATLSVVYDPATLHGTPETELEFKVLSAGTWFSLPTVVDTKSHRLQAFLRTLHTVAIGRKPPSPPTAMALPLSGANIRLGTPIVVTFNTRMDHRSLRLSGALAGAVGGIAWSRKDDDDTSNVHDSWCDTHGWAHHDGPAWNGDPERSRRCGQERDQFDVLTLTPKVGWPTGAETLTVEAKDRHRRPIVPLALAYTVDALPTAAVAPAAGATISQTAQIIISFSETMDIQATTFGGSLAAAASAGVWISSAAVNDTLVVSPGKAWPGGTQTLVVNTEDLAGDPATVSLSYDVHVDFPSATVAPENGSTLTVVSPITVTFSHAMDPLSLTLTGSMTGAGQVIPPTSGVAWNAGNTAVTLSPSVRWTASNNASLVLNAADTLGNFLTMPLVLSYALPDVLYFAGSDPTALLAIQMNADGTFLASSSIEPKYVFQGGYTFDGISSVLTLTPGTVLCATCIPGLQSIPASLVPDVPASVSYSVDQFSGSTIHMTRTDDPTDIVSLAGALSFGFAQPLPNRQFTLSVSLPTGLYTNLPIAMRLAPVNGTGHGHLVVATVDANGNAAFDFSIPQSEFDTPVKDYVMLAVIVRSLQDLQFGMDGSSLTGASNVVTSTVGHPVILHITQTDQSTAPFQVPFLNL